MIKVLLVDDHDLVRTGIRHMLTGVAGISVIGEAASGEDALSRARELQPDLILMDVRMPGIGGLEATRRILLSHPQIKVIGVSVCEEEPFPSRLMEAGATGYLTKGAGLDEMIQAIRSVHAGGRYLSPGVANTLAWNTVKPSLDGSPFSQLSDRELQVAMMVAEGLPVQDISDRLSLSPKTINTYRYRLFEKLGISSDVQLTRLAMRHGIVDAGH